MILKVWVNDWLVFYKKPFVSTNTVKTINYCLAHVLVEFGERDIESINGIEIQRMLAGLSDRPNIADKCRKYLNDIFDMAYRNRIIDWNPMSAVKFKTYHFKNTKPMNAKQRSKFIKSLVGKNYEALYLTYLYTGCRRNELISPGSFVVDYDKRLVYIHGTKTEKSDRVIPLFDKLECLLKKLPDYKSYFCSFKPNWVQLCLSRHLKKIGMNGFSVRSLRCTFSLMCYELGIRETTIQSWLGHTTTKTTTSFYLNKEEIAKSKLDAVQSEIDLINKKL